MSFHKPYIIYTSLKFLKRVSMVAHPLQFTEAICSLGDEAIPDLRGDCFVARGATRNDGAIV